MTDPWYGRQALVAGAAGFIGSHLVQSLARNGTRVRAFVRYNFRGEVGLLSMLPPDLYVETVGDER
jgi:dTDP-glucose 4,6-dehydratase